MAACTPRVSRADSALLRGGRGIQGGGASSPLVAARTAFAFTLLPRRRETSPCSDATRREFPGQDSGPACITAGSDLQLANSATPARVSVCLSRRFEEGCPRATSRPVANRTGFASSRKTPPRDLGGGFAFGVGDSRSWDAARGSLVRAWSSPAGLGAGAAAPDRGDSL